MCPADRFPRISAQATFQEAIQAMEKAHADYRSGKMRQCILLVEDDAGSVIGKLSPMDAIRALEPKYNKIDSLGDNIRFGVPQAFAAMKEDFRLWQEPLHDLCRKAFNMKVDSMIDAPGETQSVIITDRLDNALHLFASTHHHSLFVIENNEIVGLLLLADVYEAICNIIKECKIDD